MAAAKTYQHHSKNSTYIAEDGTVHTFLPVGNVGEITTEDEELQKQLDAAVASGSPIRIKGSTGPNPQPAAHNPKLAAAQALAAMNKDAAAARIANEAAAQEQAKLNAALAKQDAELAAGKDIQPKQ